MSEKDLGKRIKLLEKQMLEHARNLEFEKAARVRDQLALLREQAFGAAVTRSCRRPAATGRAFVVRADRVANGTLRGNLDQISRVRLYLTALVGIRQGGLTRAEFSVKPPVTLLSQQPDCRSAALPRG